MYTCDYLRYFELLAYPFLFVGAGNIADDTVEDAIEWVSCSFKSFLKNSIYMYICVNVLSYVLISFKEENLLKYIVSVWLVYIYIYIYCALRFNSCFR